MSVRRQVHVVSTGHVTTQRAVTTVLVTMAGLVTTVRRVGNTDLSSQFIIDSSALGFKNNIELFLGESKMLNMICKILTIIVSVRFLTYCILCTARFKTKSLNSAFNLPIVALDPCRLSQI